MESVFSLQKYSKPIHTIRFLRYPSKGFIRIAMLGPGSFENDVGQLLKRILELVLKAFVLEKFDALMSALHRHTDLPRPRPRPVQPQRISSAFKRVTSAHLMLVKCRY